MVVIQWSHNCRYLSWVHLKFKLRAAKKNIATIVHQLLAHCYVDAGVSMDKEAAEAKLRCVCFVLSSMFIILLRTYKNVLITTCKITIANCIHWKFTFTCRTDKSNERLWEEFLSVLTVLIAEKRWELIFEVNNSAILLCHSFLKEFEKHYSIEQLISSMRERHGSMYVYRNTLYNVAQKSLMF